MIEVDGAVVASAMTAEAYLAIPEGDRRYWLVDGDLVVSSPTHEHQNLVLELAFSLRTWAAAGSDRGTANIAVDAHLDDLNVYQPDVWWLGPEHADRLVAGRLVGPPDLAIEVLSPSTQRFDRGPKLRGYERTGCGEVWLVDGSARRLFVHRRLAVSSARYETRLELGPADVVSSPLLPGFALDLSVLFAD
jgi:Uma2 family endonuclease